MGYTPAYVPLMPRVNRDMQRRLAARRERERRRPPTERRYRFASADQTLAPAEEPAPDTGADESLRAAAERPARETRPVETRPSVRDGRAPARSFSEYASDYAYVIGDLRRVVLVVGSLLVILIVLYFVLPR